MTVPVSTVPAAKAALVALISAQPTVTDPNGDIETIVSYDDPGPNTANDFVVVGNVSRQVATLALIGSYQQGSLQEQYTVTVICEAFRGDSAQTASERAWALASAVEQSVRNNPTLNSSVAQAVPGSTADEGTWDADGKGFTATVTVSVEVLAFI